MSKLVVKERISSAELFNRGLDSQPTVKKSHTYEMKENFYKASDGIFGLQDDFKKNKDNQALNIVKKMEKLQDELYKHIGGI